MQSSTLSFLQIIDIVSLDSISKRGETKKLVTHTFIQIIISQLVQKYEVFSFQFNLPMESSRICLIIKRSYF